MSKKHIATKERRALVEKATGLGLREVDIAALLKISDKTLRARYADQLRRGHAEATMKVGQRLFEIATGDNDKLALTASIFWMKCRAQWREADAQSINVTANASAQSAGVITVPGMMIFDSGAHQSRFVPSS